MTLIAFTGADNMPIAPHKYTTDSADTSRMFDITGRDGSTSGAVSISTTNIGSGIGPMWIWVFPSSYASMVVGFAVRYPTSTSLTSTSNNLITFRNAAGVDQLSFSLSSTGYLEMRTGNAQGTLLTTLVTDPYTVNTWTHYQFKVVLDSTSGTAIVRMNNVEILNWTGQTALATGSIGQVYFAGTRAVVSGHGVHWDDLWFCDTVDATLTQGLPNNDFLGDLRVASLRASAAGSASDWSSSTGGSNYTAVDDNPVSTTDYVHSNVSSTPDTDLYALANMPSNAGSVYAVQNVMAFAKTDIEGGGTLGHKIKENSVVTSLNQVNYLTITVSNQESDLMAVKPSDSLVWSVNDVDSMEAGFDTR